MCLRKHSRSRAREKNNDSEATFCQESDGGKQPVNRLECRIWESIRPEDLHTAAASAHLAAPPLLAPLIVSLQ